MKNTLLILILFAFTVIGNAQQAINFHDFNGITIQGDTISFDQFAGKKLLVVNTASFCAYTYQYEDLQSLYQMYGGENFEIIGFPCNNFGSQEPGSDSTINEFCTGNYGVTFQMMERIDIKTGDTAEVYKWLQRGELNGVEDAQVTWNFHKFLIDADGNWVNHFPSTTGPRDTAITNWITADVNTVGIRVLSTQPVQLFPNPSSGASNLQFETAVPRHIRVFNSLGKEILNTLSTLSNVQINLTAKGIYFVQIEEKGSLKTQKLIIK